MSLGGERGTGGAEIGNEGSVSRGDQRGQVFGADFG